jgi:hypothetical protein
MARPRLVALLVMCAAVAWSGAGVAQTLMTAPEPVGVGETPIRPSFPRPRLSAAVGLGATFDDAGFSDGSSHAIPAFFTMLGIGDGLWSFELRVFVSQAAGRFGSQNPIDRLAVDTSGVLRVGMLLAPDNHRYGTRVLRTIGVELGPSFEREGRSMMGGSRFAISTGARVEVPLTPAREPSELRLRLAVRRAFGLYTPILYGSSAGDVTAVGDSDLELYGALVLIF